MHQWHDSLQHLWTHVTDGVGLPEFQGAVYDVGPPQIPSLPEAPAPVQYRQVCFQISLPTANVNSLHAGPDGYSGKLQFIRDQMKEFHLFMMGVQEARSTSMCSQTDEVLRLGSGSDRGHHGVELWINLRQPFAYVGKKPVYLTKQHVVVVHCDPRLMLVRISHDLWHSLIIVAHAPQSGQPDVVREQWWEALDQIAQQHAKNQELYVLIDANAEPGPVDHRHVGPADTCVSKSTSKLRDFWRTWNLWLPCAFPCHVGTQDTWTAPDGASKHCIDHVCLPLRRFHDCKTSQVVDAFDLGNGLTDHRVVVAQVEWFDNLAVGRTTRPAPGVQRDSITREALQPLLDRFNVPPWQQDIQSHVETHTQHLMSCLRQACPKQPHAPKKSFTTPELWQLRTDKLCSRKQCREIARRERYELLRAVWLEWRSMASGQSCIHSNHGEVYQWYVTALKCWKLHQHVHLHVVATRLKHGVKNARSQALQRDLLLLPEHASASDALHVVKQHVGSTNLKTLKKPTLPMLENLDGELCSQPEQLQDTWIDFFRQMEGCQNVMGPACTGLVPISGVVQTAWAFPWPARCAEPDRPWISVP